MINMQTDERIPSRGLPILVFALVLFAWWFLTAVFSIPSYILPSPMDIVSATSKIGDSFWRDFAVTAAEALGGFFLGGASAFLFAVAFAHYSMIEKSFMPYVIAMKTIPIVAIAPLLVIWFGAGILPKFILSALICFFPVLVGALKGMKEVDPDQIDLFESLAASRWQVFKWLRLPNSLTYLFPALRVSIVFAVIGAIVAEFASANAGLGFKIMMASYHVDTPVMFLYILATSILSLVLYGIVVAAERYFVPWSFSARESLIKGE
ncbi:ABC transporter permease [Candidatus Sumerlaeota bacterium]